MGGRTRREEKGTRVDGSVSESSEDKGRAKRSRSSRGDAAPGPDRPLSFPEPSEGPGALAGPDTCPVWEGSAVSPAKAPVSMLSVAVLRPVPHRTRWIKLHVTRAIR